MMFHAKPFSTSFSSILTRPNFVQRILFRPRHRPYQGKFTLFSSSTAPHQTRAYEALTQRFSLRKSSFSRKLSSSIKKTTEKALDKSAKTVRQSEAVTGGKQQKKSFLSQWIAPREMPPRGTLTWYGEMCLICTVFAVTGTSTMVMVRPAVSEVLGLQGSLKDGPWSYRICSLVIMTPLYSAVLVVVGTIFGRHAYFRHFAVKMFKRFGVPPELLDKNFEKTAKNFRKW